MRKKLGILLLTNSISAQSLAADCRDDLPGDDCLEKVYSEFFL